MPNRLFKGTRVEKTSLPFPQAIRNTLCLQTTAEETHKESKPPVVAYATIAATMCVKVPWDYLKDMLGRAKLQFEGFDNAMQPQKPHWESMRPVFASPFYSLLFYTMQEPSAARQNMGKLMLY